MRAHREEEVVRGFARARRGSRRLGRPAGLLVGLRFAGRRDLLVRRAGLVDADLDQAVAERRSACAWFDRPSDLPRARACRCPCPCRAGSGLPGGSGATPGGSSRVANRQPASWTGLCSWLGAMVRAQLASTSTDLRKPWLTSAVLAFHRGKIADLSHRAAIFPARGCPACGPPWRARARGPGAGAAS